MKVRKITATHECKDGLLKYSNTVHKITMEAELDKGESAQVAGVALLKCCKAVVLKEREKTLEAYWKGKEEQRKKFESGIS